MKGFEVLKVIVTWSLQVPQRFLLFEALLGSRASGNPARTVGNPWWTKHLSKSCDCKTPRVDQKLIDFVMSTGSMNTSTEVRVDFFPVAPHKRFGSSAVSPVVRSLPSLSGIFPRAFW